MIGFPVFGLRMIRNPDFIYSEKEGITMECVIAGVVTVGFVVLDEGVKHLCRHCLKRQEA